MSTGPNQASTSYEGRVLNNGCSVQNEVLTKFGVDSEVNLRFNLKVNWVCNVDTIWEKNTDGNQYNLSVNLVSALTWEMLRKWCILHFRFALGKRKRSWKISNESYVCETEKSELTTKWCGMMLVTHTQDSQPAAVSVLDGPSEDCRHIAYLHGDALTWIQLKRTPTNR